MQQLAAAAAALENAVRRSAGSRLVTRLREHATGQREGGDRQRGPVGQELVVGARPHALRTRSIHLRAGPFEKRNDLALRAAETFGELRNTRCDRKNRLAVLEVTRRRHAEARGDDRCVLWTDGRRKRLRIPDVKRALLAFGVGILRREKAAALGSHLAEEIIERLGRNACGLFCTGPSVQKSPVREQVR